MWSPKTIKRFIRSFPTSTRTALVETDEGYGYVKAMGNPEGLHTLASEVLAVELASWLGLPTFEWAIIPVSDLDEIPFEDGERTQAAAAMPGPAFITRQISGQTWYGTIDELNKLDNAHDISRLIVFDTWTLNCDRHSVPRPGHEGRARVNHDNVFLAEASAGRLHLMAMDHTHCFTCGRDWTVRLAEINNVKDTRLFGVFPEFRDFVNRETVRVVLSRLSKFTEAVSDAALEKLPTAWQVSPGLRAAMSEFLRRRAVFLVERFETMFWPQGELFNDGTGGP